LVKASQSQGLKGKKMGFTLWGNIEKRQVQSPTFRVNEESKPSSGEGEWGGAPYRGSKTRENIRGSSKKLEARFGNLGVNAKELPKKGGGTKKNREVRMHDNQSGSSVHKAAGGPPFPPRRILKKNRKNGST